MTPNRRWPSNGGNLKKGQPRKAALTTAATSVTPTCTYVVISNDRGHQANGEIHEPLSRDEYSEQTEQAPAADDDSTPESIEEPDLSAIDAYDSEPDLAEFQPHETDPDEESGGTLTEHANHDGASQETPQASRDSASKSDDAASSEADDERISALEAENTDAQREVADLKAQNGELSARLDRVEGLLADLAKRSDGDSSPVKRGEERSTTAVDEQDRHDAVHQAEIAERNDSKEGADSKDAEPSRWRRMTSAENVGIAGTAVGAADTLAQFTMHATPEGVVGVSATILGLIATGLAKVEQNKAKKSKEHT